MKTIPFDIRGWVILSVQDTRAFDPESWKPLSGTGDERACDHCGRTIEIHATMEAADPRAGVAVGTQRVIGTGCLGTAGREAARRAASRRCWDLDRCLTKLESPFHLEGYIRGRWTVEDMIRHGLWDALAALDAWRGRRRAAEAEVVRILERYGRNGVGGG